MRIIKMFVLIVIALSSGVIISSGVYSFLASIGVFPRLISSTHSAKHIRLYEDIIIAGGISGNIFYLSHMQLNNGGFVAIVYALFTGIFVGALAMSLAEIINSMAVCFHKIKLKHGIRIAIYAIVIGKLIGALMM